MIQKTDQSITGEIFNISICEAILSSIAAKDLIIQFLNNKTTKTKKKWGKEEDSLLKDQIRLAHKIDINEEIKAPRFDL